MLKDYYSILGISFNASDDEIKRAYRALSKRWHPDVNPGLDTTAIMQDINEAYFILRDSAMRVRYDAEYVKKTAGYDMQDVVLRQAIKKARESAASYVRRIVANWVRKVSAGMKIIAQHAIVVIPKFSSVAMVALITASMDTMCNRIELMQPKSRASSAVVYESDLRNTRHKQCEPFTLDQVFDAINYKNQMQLKNENHNSTNDYFMYQNINSIKD